MDQVQHGDVAGLGTAWHEANSQVPHGHWKTTTFLAALRHDGIEAPWVLDGLIDREGFTIRFSTAGPVKLSIELPGIYYSSRSPRFLGT